MESVPACSTLPPVTSWWNLSLGNARLYDGHVASFSERLPKNKTNTGKCTQKVLFLDYNNTQKRKNLGHFGAHVL